MMTAAQMSARIKAKKKKMEDESGAVKLSGIPEDATDIDAIKQEEPGEELSENTPEDHDESPSLEELRAEETKPDPEMSEVSPDPHQINQPADGSTEARGEDHSELLNRYKGIKVQKMAQGGMVKDEPHVDAHEPSDGPILMMSDGGDVLDAEARKHIAPHNFALPGGRYPIHDMAHARNALARVAQHGTPEEQAEVRRKVHAKYPSIGEEHKAMGGDMEMNDDKKARMMKMRSAMAKVRK